MTKTQLICDGCSTLALEKEPFPFRCRTARRDDDLDHLLVRKISSDQEMDLLITDDANPYKRYRSLFHSHRFALEHDLTDQAFLEIVDRLDRSISEIDGKGFRVTPLDPVPGLASRLGVHDVFVKNETGNVSGSHKGRHFMGVAIWMEVVRATGMVDQIPQLAIASCGNAALAAAVVARAAGYQLEVFVPPHASATEPLQRLGAQVTPCPRRAGEVGDPCYLAFQRAVQEGSLPFTCQGNENGLVVESGETLGWELIAQLDQSGHHLDRIFVQVGGGALASSLVRAYDDARKLGCDVRLPRLHAVQTGGAYPLVRAWDRVAGRILEQMQGHGIIDTIKGLSDPDRATVIHETCPRGIMEDELQRARRQRSQVMWPWETEPKSIAAGILDDETYDWAAVVEGMLISGGHPVVASEETLAEANRLGREATGIPVDPTGSSGLAGALELSKAGELGTGERIAVLFTGHER